MAGDPQNDGPHDETAPQGGEPASPLRGEAGETGRARALAPQQPTTDRINGPAAASHDVGAEQRGEHTATTSVAAGVDGLRGHDADDPAPGDDADLPGEGTTADGTAARTVIREIVETLLLALLVFLAVRASFQNFKVDGESMMPTLHNGQFMIVNKIEFAQVDAGQLSRFIPFLNADPHEKRDVFHGPERGDIVVLVNPRQTDMDLVKRVIGLPGETLQIVDGHVYINDHLLIEPYIKQPWGGSTPKITIPKDEYFVMGDNRTNSLDSRSRQVGLIPRDLMIGKAMLSYWPLSRFGLAPNASPKLSATETTPKVASSISGAAAGS